MQAFRIISAALCVFLFSLVWAPLETNAQTSNTASFLRLDTTTQGNWHGAYGADGYSVAGDSQNLPGYASFAVQNASDYTWASNPVDPRALQTGSGSGRIAATWYSSTSFNLDVNFADGNAHQLAVYAVDWDGQGRAETVQVLDATTATSLDTRSISNFTGGVYLVWTVTGHVTVSVILDSGPNGVLSGVFFGSNSAINSTAAFLRTDVTTEGNWHGTYGADGYSVANDSSSMPAYAALSLQNQLAWTWAPSTGDMRALETGSGIGRIAATWYNSLNFSLDVNLADGNSHQIALYAIDWDSQGRSETIQVLDAATEAILDTRSISSFTNGTYLVWNISGHVRINVTGTAGPNAVVSGVFFGGSSTITATASFLQSDTSTQGNWHGAYGADGYSLANDFQSIPAYTSFAVQNQANYTWEASTEDTRALQSGSGVGRIAATWYSASTFTFDVNLTDGKQHQFALYAVDWDNQGRSEIVQVLDAATNALLDTESLSSFAQGSYLVWNVSGHVRVNIIGTGGPSAAVSGVFFGGSSAVTATASFIRSDTTTEGNWHGAYGADGYSVANDSQSLPAYSSFAVENGANWTWDAETADPRALQTGNGVGRLAATWYGEPAFSFDLNFTDGNSHQFALYATDFDNQGRSEFIQIIDATTEALLDTRALPAFTSGTYLVWNISGHVRINVIGTSGPNAVVSGVFFGGSSTINSTAAFVRSDTSTQGNWQGSYGADGYSIANDSQSLPIYMSFAMQNEANWTWDPSPTDPRALQTASGAGRIAATWYNNPSFTFDVNITDGQSHQLALYAMDWDSQGRSEIIQVIDATTEAVLDSETLSAFTNGVYLVWNVSGHVRINVIGTGGPNAVVSGVFFDPVAPTSPTITGLSPGTGPLGTVVTVSGMNFGNPQGNSTVSFNGTAGTPTNWTATSITVPVPSGATTGDVVATVGGTNSNGVLFTVQPTITSISPTSVSPGMQMTIAGSGFGGAQLSGYAILGNLYGAVVTWSDTQIVVTVQPGTSSGSVYVHQAGYDSNAVPFTSSTDPALPAIASLSPASGLPGDLVVLNGVNFGSAQGNSIVTFSGQTANVASWSDKSITAYAPYGITTGDVVVTVSGVGSSNGVPFTVSNPPAITSVTPNSGSPGTVVNITGTNFGSSQGSSYVVFPGGQATASAWSDNSITVSVPAGATTGNVEVDVCDAYACAGSNDVSFTVPPTAPTINALSPPSGLPGMAIVTISGTNFGTRQGNSTVKFNGVLGGPTGWTASSITVPVPYGATSGNVVVTVNGLQSNGVNFAVATLASITVRPTNGSMVVGNTQQFSASGTYSDGTILALGAVTWSSSVTTVATIDGSGRVTADSLGQTTIEAAAQNVVGSATLTVTPTIGSFASTGGLGVARGAHTATMLNNGQVLIAGGVVTSSTNTPSSTNSAELYDPSSGSFSATGSLNTARSAHTASLLNSGMVLLAGGQDNSGTVLASAELYDPAAETFFLTGSLSTPRRFATATVLSNGKVLIVGGQDNTGSILSSAEIYDPVAGTLALTGSLNTGRAYHTATLLNNGKVLIAGGESEGVTALSSAELYDPTTGLFTTTGNLNDARNSQSATLLNGGKVLIAQGVDNNSNILASAELYDPASGTFSYTGSPNEQRSGSSASLLTNGTVLLAGGIDVNGKGIQCAEFYDPVAGTFTPVGNMAAARKSLTATLLNDGSILLTGGFDDKSVAIGSAEIYEPSTTTPANLVSISVSPVGASIPVATGQPLTASATFSDGSTQSLASAIWNSSDPTVVSVTNDSTNPGTAFAVSAGSATVNACAGSICGSTIVTTQPTQLTAIVITPASSTLVTGSSVSLLATGTYADGGTQDLTTSATWSSSSPSVASVNGAGIASAVAAGTATITVTSGSITGSATLTVTKPVTSIAVSPQAPALFIGATQQLTATATFNDATTGDITAIATWTSEAPQVAAVGSGGAVTGVASGMITISASLGGAAGSTVVTVTSNPPVIASVSPTSGGAGTQVTITGSGFGATQGQGYLLLGSTNGIVVSWSDAQIVALVAGASTSGVVQVTQLGLQSNSVNFAVAVPTITSVTPTIGVAGTQVTITGSGFGTTQGNGQVWLGSANAIASSWSDAQVVATVAAGSTTGNAQILQGAVWSNSVPFTINIPTISSITPNSGAAGTVVTISGSGFGSSQGNGAVWIGSTYGSVLQWSDSTVVASVAPGAVSGIVKVQQNGTWSNAMTFTVPSSFSSGSGGSVTLVPNVISMVVGDTRSIQAMGSNGKPVTGLTWTSSNTSVVTLSTDDPPVLTAVAPGNATILAGGASADVTVYPGSGLPIGTVQWSNPGDGSGVYNFTPAVPSSSGTDVFAFNQSGNIQAMGADGSIVWTANVQNLPGTFYQADFQGGVNVFNESSIYSLDPATGQPHSAYQQEYTFLGGGLGFPAIHTDGTVFTVENGCAPTPDDCTGSTDSETGSWIVGIDPSTGQAKFRVPTALYNEMYTIDSPQSLCGTSHSGQLQFPSFPDNPLSIAGDGYAYTSYTTDDETLNIKEAQEPFSGKTYADANMLAKDLFDDNDLTAAQNDFASLYADSGNLAYLNDVAADLCFEDAGCTPDFNQAYIDYGPVYFNFLQPLCDRSEKDDYKYHILRVGTDGSSSDAIVKEWQTSYEKVYDASGGNPWHVTVTQDDPYLHIGPSSFITNADQGVVVSWGFAQLSYCAASSDGVCTSMVDPTGEYHLTGVTGGGVSSDVVWVPPGLDVAQNEAQLVVEPVLQLQDGSFVASDGGMLDFDQFGNIRWFVPQDSPRIATADGGLIGYTGTTYDANGNATGQVSTLASNWLGDASYSAAGSGVVSSAGPPPDYAPQYAAINGNNQSGNGTAVQQTWYPPLPSCMDPMLHPSISCPGPKESAYSALAALRTLVASPCLNCAAYVFEPLGTINDQTVFAKFLSHRPGLYNGTRSNMPLSNICTLGSWDGLKCSVGLISEFRTTSQYFNSTPGLLAISQMPAKNGLLVFLDPSQICKVYASKDYGIFNQANLFHESLHGFYGKDDATIQQEFGILVEDSTINITFYIQTNVFKRPASICGN